jgi:hypothetical protein
LLRVGHDPAGAAAGRRGLIEIAGH